MNERIQAWTNEYKSAMGYKSLCKDQNSLPFIIFTKYIRAGVYVYHACKEKNQYWIQSLKSPKPDLVTWQSGKVHQSHQGHILESKSARRYLTAARHGYRQGSDYSIVLHLSARLHRMDPDQNAQLTKDNIPSQPGRTLEWTFHLAQLFHVWRLAAPAQRCELVAVRV